MVSTLKSRATRVLSHHILLSNYSLVVGSAKAAETSITVCISQMSLYKFQSSLGYQDKPHYGVSRSCK